MSDPFIEFSLTNGGIVLVDVADLPKLEGYIWRIHSTGKYAYAAQYDPDIRGNRFVLMHRLLLGAAKGSPKVDHINGDGLDNRRANLRFASDGESARNCRKLRPGKHPYKGISSGPRPGRPGYTACICVNRKRRYLGTFPTVELAAEAYDRAAIELHGEFACLNFPRVSDS